MVFVLDMMTVVVISVVGILWRHIMHAGKIKYSSSISVMMLFDGLISSIVFVILLTTGNLYTLQSTTENQ
jgi:hypothetical protein